MYVVLYLYLCRTTTSGSWCLPEVQPRSHLLAESSCCFVSAGGDDGRHLYTLRHWKQSSPNPSHCPPVKYNMKNAADS